jgi:hypothetical protein
MYLFNLNQVFYNNLYVIDSEPLIYRWGGHFDYSEISILLNDYITINTNLLFLKIKKIISVLFLISFKKGICLFFFLNFYKRFFLNELLNSKVKFFYIIFIDKVYSFLTRFKFYILKYKKFKLYSNYINPINGSCRFPYVIFVSKKCWKNYFKFFYSFIRLRLICIKSKSIIGLNDSTCYCLFINNCKNIYFMFKAIYLLTNKQFKLW